MMKVRRGEGDDTYHQDQYNKRHRSPLNLSIIILSRKVFWFEMIERFSFEFGKIVGRRSAASHAL